MSDTGREPGWDKRAVNEIAKHYYGGLEAMFRAHKWSKDDGKSLSQIAPTRVVEAYGSIKHFQAQHPSLPVMAPRAAILSSTPNVWLTSFYGFSPETWGFLGFSNDQQRSSFLNRSEPGALVVVYGHKTKAPKHQQGKIIGLLQMSHEVNSADAYIAPREWVRKERDKESKGKWNLAVKAVRAWHVSQESYWEVEKFADKTYSRKTAQTIGSQGMKLSPDEAKKIFELELVECSVFGEVPVFGASVASGQQHFSPSRPGPVSQSPYVVREAEGPKELYVLELIGQCTAFSSDLHGDAKIIKVGFSKSPISRQATLNGALPGAAFSWRVLQSHRTLGLSLLPNSRAAIAGENAMKRFLHKHGKSLGGEFFIAEPSLIDRAWKEAIAASR